MKSLLKFSKIIYIRYPFINQVNYSLRKKINMRKINKCIIFIIKKIDYEPSPILN